MHIVIDTKKLDFTYFENAQDVIKAFNAVNNAKIAELPNNHGKLIDADELVKRNCKIVKNAYGVVGMTGITFENISKEDVDNAPAILKSSKGGD